jgi:hypothetical protein
MKLFDDDHVISRTDLAPAPYGEPSFQYLNRSGRPVAAQVRSLLESWFQSYPESGKAALRSRFRSTDSVPHHSAFFELYMHELLKGLGYAVEIHPHLLTGTTRPDFLVSKAGQASFILEATLATNISYREAAANARLNSVYNALNQVLSPNFFIGIEVFGTPSTPVPGKKLRKAVELFLQGLNPDAVGAVLQGGGGLGDLPRGQFTHGDWSIEFYPIAKSHAARGKPGIRPLGILGPGGAREVDDRGPLRDAILAKGGRYGDLGVPYIIAVDALGQWWLDRSDIMEALFGQEAFYFDPLNPGEPQMTRNPDGAWFGKKGRQYTRVSAVLIGGDITPWTVGARIPVIYHNPWAKHPCPDALAQLRSAHPENNTMKEREGLTGYDIFGLPAGWPTESS